MNLCLSLPGEGHSVWGPLPAPPGPCAQARGSRVVVALVPVAWGLSGCEAQPFPGKLKLTATGPSVPSRRPLPEAMLVSFGQAAATAATTEGWPEALSFHQLIIFTNLQPRKKLHSGLETPARSWWERDARGGRRPSGPEATSCRSSGSFLRPWAARSPVALWIRAVSPTNGCEAPGPAPVPSPQQGPTCPSFCPWAPRGLLACWGDVTCGWTVTSQALSGDLRGSHA